MAKVRRATLPKITTSTDVLSAAQDYARATAEFIDACNRHLEHTRQPHECGADEICKRRRDATIVFTRAQNYLLDLAGNFKPPPTPA